MISCVSLRAQLGAGARPRCASCGQACPVRPTATRHARRSDGLEEELRLVDPSLLRVRLGRRPHCRARRRSRGRDCSRCAPRARARPVTSFSTAQRANPPRAGLSACRWMRPCCRSRRYARRSPTPSAAELTVCVAQGFGLGVPLGYFYGHQSPQENPELYKRLVTSLAAQVRLSNSAPALAIPQNALSMPRRTRC